MAVGRLKHKLGYTALNTSKIIYRKNASKKASNTLGGPKHRVYLGPRVTKRKKNVLFSF